MRTLRTAVRDAVSTEVLARWTPTAFLLAGALTTYARPGSSTGIDISDTVRAPDAWFAVVAVALTVPLGARRRLPGLVLVVVAAAFAVRAVAQLHPSAADFAVLVAAFSAARHARGRQWWGVACYAALPCAVFLQPDAQRVDPGAFAWIVTAVVVVPLALGAVARVLAPAREPAPASSPGAGGAAPSASRFPALLTPREQEVLALLADGLSNRQIAARLHLAPSTVKMHVHAVLAKTGARNRVQAAALAEAATRAKSPDGWGSAPRPGTTI